MATGVQARATLDDLYQVTGKAELVGGRIVALMPTGRKPHRVAFRVARSLDDHAQQIGRGEAYCDNVGYAVPLLPSGRESFSPDASYYDSPFLDTICASYEARRISRLKSVARTTTTRRRSSTWPPNAGLLRRGDFSRLGCRSGQ
jgi:hypothetical protein